MIKTLLIVSVLLLALVACQSQRPDPTQQAALGSQIYQQNCAVCHGVSGEGQPGWQIQRDDSTYPAPPHDETGHTWHHTDGLLFRIVKNGGASLNIPAFKSGMPAFGEKLTDEEIEAVINHLKTFWLAEQRAGQAEISERDPFP